MAKFLNFLQFFFKNCRKDWAEFSLSRSPEHDLSNLLNLRSKYIWVVKIFASKMAKVEQIFKTFQVLLISPKYSVGVA